jgi:hypothetical protein
VELPGAVLHRKPGPHHPVAQRRLVA